MKALQMKTQRFFSRVWSSLMLVTIVVSTVLAHSPKETHTLIANNNFHTVVQVDLPWTANEAARKYYKIPEGAQISDEETKAYTQRYIKDNLSLYSDGKQIVPVSLSIVPQSHGHSITYELLYRQIDLAQLQVRNELMLNNSEKQKNYIRIVYGENEVLSGITDRQNTWFRISNSAYSRVLFSPSYRAILVVLSVMVALGIGFIKLGTFRFAAD